MGIFDNGVPYGKEGVTTFRGCLASMRTGVENKCFLGDDLAVG